MAIDADRVGALERLPLPYAMALRLRAAGIADDVIAECLGLAPEALPMFMRVAEAKLAAARGQPSQDGCDG